MIEGQSTVDSNESKALSDENVIVLETGTRRLVLVGTAHVSHESATLVEAIIREERPDFVAVELCASRYAALQDPDRWKNMDLVSVIRSGKSYVLMAQLMLAGFQKKLGNQLKIKPGEEMMRAIATARETGAEVVLADRDVRTTLKRTWSSLSLWSLCKLAWGMLSSVFSDEKIDAAEIERLKKADAIEELMSDFSKALPQVREALIDERDRYLAAKIAAATGPKIVAVVGAGHLSGIRKSLDNPVELGPLELIPEPSLWRKALSWVLPAAFLLILAYGVYEAGSARGVEMLSSWFWITGITGAIGSALALAHPLTIITAFIVSPFTTLNPFIASGWLAGLVEAWIRKPRVGDLETLADDLTTAKGWWKNRVSRVLLVIALTNLVGSLGTFIALGKLASLL